MTPPELHTELADVQQKLKRLLDKYSALQKETNRLQNEYKVVLSQLEAKDQEIKQLNGQIAVLKSGIQEWHPEQKKLFVKRIDTYLKEIEKCLALINE